MEFTICSLIMVVSILLQFASALVALFLIVRSGYYLPWIAISTAVLLMGIRRLTSFLLFIQTAHDCQAQIVPESIALLISALMFTGLVFLSPAFRLLREQHAKELENKDLLIRETHHHVKNDLQLLQSLIRLQESDTQSSGGAEILRDLTSRISVISVLHQKLYQQQNIEFSDYIRSIVSTIQSVQGNTQLRFDVHIPQNIQLSISATLQLGLIVNEAVTNACKHATDGIDAPVVTIQAHTSDRTLTLHIRDNGPGIPEDVLRDHSTSFGLTIIESIGSAPGWSCSIANENGARVTLSLPLDS